MDSQEKITLRARSSRPRRRRQGKGERERTPVQLKDDNPTPQTPSQADDPDSGNTGKGKKAKITVQAAIPTVAEAAAPPGRPPPPPAAPGPPAPPAPPAQNPQLSSTSQSSVRLPSSMSTTFSTSTAIITSSSSTATFTIVTSTSSPLAPLPVSTTSPVFIPPPATTSSTAVASALPPLNPVTVASLPPTSSLVPSVPAQVSSSSSPGTLFTSSTGSTASPFLVLPSLTAIPITTTIVPPLLSTSDAPTIFPPVSITASTTASFDPATNTVAQATEGRPTNTDVFPTNAASTAGSNASLSAGRTAGIVVGAVGAFALIAGLVFFLFRKRGRRLPFFEILESPAASIRSRDSVAHAKQPGGDMSVLAAAEACPAGADVAAGAFPGAGVRTSIRSSRRWSNSQTSLRLPPYDVEKPRPASSSTLRRSIGRLRWFGAPGPLTLNPVPEEEDEGLASTPRKYHDPRTPVKSITSMFFARFSRTKSGLFNRNSTGSVAVEHDDEGEGARGRTRTVGSWESGDVRGGLRSPASTWATDISRDTRSAGPPNMNAVSLLQPPVHTPSTQSVNTGEVHIAQQAEIVFANPVPPSHSDGRSPSPVSTVRLARSPSGARISAVSPDVDVSRDPRESVVSAVSSLSSATSHDGPADIPSTLS